MAGVVDCLTVASFAHGGGPIYTLSVDIPKAKFSFVDRGIKRKFAFVAMFPSTGGDTDYWGTARQKTSPTTSERTA